jgi:hypothetical protein
MIMIDKLINKAKALIGKIKVPQVKIQAVPKIKMPNLKPLLEKAKPLLNKAKPVLVKAIGLLKKALGLVIAWLTLTGTAQQIVGIATIAATILWLVTIPLREEKE